MNSSDFTSIESGSTILFLQVMLFGSVVQYLFQLLSKLLLPHFSSKLTSVKSSNTSYQQRQKFTIQKRDLANEHKQTIFDNKTIIYVKLQTRNPPL